MLRRKRPYDFNKYAVGNIRYPSGAGPNTGKKLDKKGYIERSNRAKVRKLAAVKKLQAKRKGNYFSSDWLRQGTFKGY